MATNEKKLDTFRNLVVISLILYIVGLFTNVIRVRSFGFTVVSYAFSDLVNEGYLNGVVMIPLYLGIVAAFVAIMTVTKDETYFKISAFSSAILPIFTLFALVGAKNQIEKDIGLDEEFGFVVSGSYDLGALAVALGIILSFIAAIKYNTDEDQEKIITRSQRNVMIDPRYKLPKPTNPPTDPYANQAPIQNYQSKPIDVSEKKTYSSKFCANCGNEIVEGNLFCMRCGVKVES